MASKSMKKCMKSLAAVAALKILPAAVCLEGFFTYQNKENIKNYCKMTIFHCFLLF